MDVIHQELWISGNIPVEPTDFEPHDGLVKLDATCVWPHLLEVPESCAINKDGLPVWLCDDEPEAGERPSVSEVADSWSASAITISRCSSPVQGLDGDALCSPLLSSAPMWTDKLLRSEPEEFSEPCAITNPQEVEECLSPLLPDLDLKLETEIADVPVAIQPSQDSTASSDVGKPVTRTSHKSKRMPQMRLVKPCCVMLDRNEVSRYINEQKLMKLKTRNQVRNSRGVISILRANQPSLSKSKPHEPIVSVFKETKTTAVSVVKCLENSISLVNLGENPVSCVKPLRPWDPILTDAPEVIVDYSETCASLTEIVPQEKTKVYVNKRKCQEDYESVNKKLRECSRIVPKIILQKIVIPEIPEKLPNKVPSTKISEKLPIETPYTKISEKFPVSIETPSTKIPEKLPVEIPSAKISEKLPIMNPTNESSEKLRIETQATKISEPNETPCTEMPTPSPERLVLKIVKKGDTLQVLSPNDTKTDDISPKINKILSENSKYADKLKILVKKHEETQKEIKKLENQVHRKDRKTSEHRVPPINNFTIETGSVIRYQCSECERHFSRSSGVYRHLKVTHDISGVKVKSTKIPTYSCSKCTLVSFLKHEVKHHICENLAEDEFDINKELLGESNYKFSCYHCDEKFKSSNKLKKHVFWTHALPVVSKNNIDVISEAVCYFCKICGNKYYSKVELQGHYDEDHCLGNDIKIKPDLSITLIENKTSIAKVKDETQIVEKKIDIKPCEEKPVTDFTPRAFLAEFEKFVQSGTKSVPQHCIEEEGELIETIDLTEDSHVEITTEPDIDVEIIETIDLTDESDVKINKNNKIKSEHKSEPEMSLILYNEHNKMFNDQNNKKSNLIAEIGNVKVDSDIAMYVQHADILKINRRVLVSEATFNKTTVPTHFKCVLCNFSTVNNVELQNHIQIHLAQDIINKSCPCGKICTNIDSLKTHINTKHKNNENCKQELIKLKSKQTAFRCRICSSIFTDPRLFYVHIYTQENENLYYHDCINCKLQFNNENKLKEHALNIHQDNTPYKCKICFKGYVQLNLLIQHIKCKHIQKCIHCIICNDHIQTEFLEEHYHMCSKNINKFSCPLCPSTFKLDRISLFTHINTKHNENSDVNFYCKICMNYFNTQYNFQLHMKTHKETYKCDYCSQICTSKLYLTEHMYLHFPKSLFMCSFCDVNFSSKYLFQQHFFEYHQSLISNFVFENM